MNDNITVPQTPDIEKAAELLRAATDAEIQRNALWMMNNQQAVAAIQPAWADPALTFYDDGGPTIEFRRKFDRISMFQSFTVDGLSFTPEGPVEITINAVASDINTLPATDSLHTAVAMLQAFDALNGAAHEQREVSNQQQQEWLDANDGLVASARPEWADSELTEVDFDYPGENDSKAEAVMFNRRVGTVAIEQAFFFDDEGGLYPPSEPQIWEEEDGHAIAIGQATVVGTDLIKAAQILNGPGEVTASMFEIVANALGINPVDLYALANVDKDPENDVTMGEMFRVGRYIGMSPAEMFTTAQRGLV